jgi:hypothetical protein
MVMMTPRVHRRWNNRSRLPRDDRRNRRTRQRSNPACSPAEARLALEHELLLGGARCLRVRFFPYPCATRRLVLVCAELADGGDVRVLCLLDVPIDMTGDDFDEAALAARFFAGPPPSCAVH